MPLGLVLQLSAADLLVQQDTTALLTITNNGPDAAVLPEPHLSPEIPALRIIEARSGIEVIRQRRPYPQGSRPRTLPVGGSIEHEFSLMDVAHVHTPGEYLVSAMVRSNGGRDFAESTPVKLTVTAVTPRTLNTTYVQGGYAFVKYGVTLNLAFDPPRLTRHCFSIRNGGGVVDAQSVVPASLLVHPTLSAPRNRQVSHDHWIAWMDGAGLHAVHMSAVDGASKPGTFKLASDEAVKPFLVSPLSIDAADEIEGRRPGAAFLWLPQKGGGAFATIDLTPDARPALGASTSVPGSRPSWAMLVDPAESPRALYFTQSDGTRSTLRLLPWPRKAAPGAIKVLHEVPGDVIAGDVLLDAADAAHGALLQISDPRERALSLARFRVTLQDGFVLGESHDIPWPFSTDIQRAVVRVGPGGIPAALLQDPNGTWSAFSPADGLVKAPSQVAQSVAAIDLAFLTEGVPLLVVGQPMSGFEVFQMDGSKLPHDCT